MWSRLHLKLTTNKTNWISRSTHLQVIENTYSSLVRARPSYYLYGIHGGIGSPSKQPPQLQILDEVKIIIYYITNLCTLQCIHNWSDHQTKLSVINNVYKYISKSTIWLFECESIREWGINAISSWQQHSRFHTCIACRVVERMGQDRVHFPNTSSQLLMQLSLATLMLYYYYLLRRI